MCMCMWKGGKFWWLDVHGQLDRLRTVAGRAHDLVAAYPILTPARPSHHHDTQGEDQHNWTAHRQRGYGVGSLNQQAGEPDKYWKQPGHPLNNDKETKGGRFGVRDVAWRAHACGDGWCHGAGAGGRYRASLFTHLPFYAPA